MRMVDPPIAFIGFIDRNASVGPYVPAHNIAAAITPLMRDSAVKTVYG
jgi:hypothetical protein